jgi:hypothetical protein
MVLVNGHVHDHVRAYGHVHEEFALSFATETS